MEKEELNLENIDEVLDEIRTDEEDFVSEEEIEQMLQALLMEPDAFEFLDFDYEDAINLTAKESNYEKGGEAE